MQDTVYALKGKGCWFQKGKEKPFRVNVASPVSFDDAVIQATGVHSSDIQCKEGDTPYNLSDVISRSGKLNFWGDCVQHALVCAAKIHAAIDPVMKPWDIAAIVPCIEEAGGIATSIRGKREDIINTVSLVSSCDKSLHNELIQMLQPKQKGRLCHK